MSKGWIFSSIKDEGRNYRRDALDSGTVQYLEENSKDSFILYYD